MYRERALHGHEEELRARREGRHAPQASRNPAPEYPGKTYPVAFWAEHFTGILPCKACKSWCFTQILPNQLRALSPTQMLTAEQNPNHNSDEETCGRLMWRSRLCCHIPRL